jgi:hypothetical protein
MFWGPVFYLKMCWRTPLLSKKCFVKPLCYLLMFWGTPLLPTNVLWDPFPTKNVLHNPSANPACFGEPFTSKKCFA